jgi:GH15 family glucan-1,4-alpha-glucosidase
MGLPVLLAPRLRVHSGCSDPQRLHDEARAWRDWLLRAIGGSPTDLQIMYGVAGERRIAEYELPSLPGYEESSTLPIR